MTEVQFRFRDDEPVADPGESAAAPEADASPKEDAAPETGDGRPRRRRRRGGGKGAAADAANLSMDEAGATAEDAPIAFADEGVGVEPPSVEDDVPPAEPASDEP